MRIMTATPTAKPIIDHARRLCARAAEGNQYVTFAVLHEAIADLRFMRNCACNKPLFSAIDTEIANLVTASRSAPESTASSIAQFLKSA